MSVWTTAGLIADGSFDDPENARIIYLAAGGLVLLAGLLGVGTWLWWRNAKVEHPALAPLEVMGSRRWWKGDFNDRRRRLDEVRHVHADDEGTESAPVARVDLDQVMVRDDPHHFDDLLEPAVSVAAAEPEPEPESEPELTFEPVAAESRSIVIDTSPRPRDTPADLGPESVDRDPTPDPTPDPIDPLLRIQAE